MRGRVWIVNMAVACAATIAFPAACTDGHHPPSGTITGRLLAVGGPAPGTARPLSGTVRLENVATHVATEVPVGRNGRYSASVSVGTYEVKGRSPMYGDGGYACAAEKTVAATTKMTAVSNVYCQLN